MGQPTSGQTRCPRSGHATDLSQVSRRAAISHGAIVLIEEKAICSVSGLLGTPSGGASRQRPKGSLAAHCLLHPSTLDTKYKLLALNRSHKFASPNVLRLCTSKLEAHPRPEFFRRLPTWQKGGDSRHTNVQTVSKKPVAGPETAFYTVT